MLFQGSSDPHKGPNSSLLLLYPFDTNKYTIHTLHTKTPLEPGSICLGDNQTNLSILWLSFSLNITLIFLFVLIRRGVKRRKHRGYYMAARGYEISLRVLKNIII